MKKRTLGITAGLVALAAVIFFVWPRESRNGIIEVETTTVTKSDFQDVISTVGLIEPVEIETFTGQGPVDEVNVELNDEVEEDDILVTYLDGSEFVAPFVGTIVEMNVEEDKVDANAQQNKASLVLANLSNLEVTIELSKSEANRVAVDQKVKLSYLDYEYDGTVTHVDAIASTGQSLPGGQGTPTLKVTISFDSEDIEPLIAGFDIDADIIISTTTDSLTIPIEAVLYNDSGKPYVFVVKDGVAQTREIETGIQEGVAIEVISGLEVEEEVIELPNEDLTDGTEVSIVNNDSEE